MEINYKILGWLHIIMGVLGALLGLFMLLFMAGVGLISGDHEAAMILPIIGLCSLGVLVVLSLPSILIGWGLLLRQSWARVATLVISFFNVFWFPIGTALAIYAFVVLLSPEASVDFNRSRP